MKGRGKREKRRRGYCWLIEITMVRNEKEESRTRDRMQRSTRKTNESTTSDE